MTESSGLTRSYAHPGVLYTHNDRGGLANLFALDASGTRAVLTLDVLAVDWEDIASTPDGKIWVGDIGDNERTRESIQVMEVDEPEVLVSDEVPSTTYQLRYPDGPHDAEALLVDPRDNRVYVVTKEPDVGRVYAAPTTLDAQGSNVLEYVGKAPLNVTGGEFSPDGELVVLRNQGRAFFYSELGGTPTEVTLPRQPQGESITFTADARHVIVGSEGVVSVLECVATPRQFQGAS